MARHEVATASASNAVPVLEPHERARWVIAFEDLADGDKEVVQAPIRKRTTDHGRAVPFAQARVAYMWMSHFGVMLGWAGLKGDDVVGDVWADLGPMQDDAKTAQTDIVQHNRFGHDLDGFPIEIDFEPIKILGQHRDVGDDFGGWRTPHGRAGARQRDLAVFNFSAELLELVLKVQEHRLRCRRPAAARDLVQPRMEGTNSVPPLGGKCHYRGQACGAGQVLVNLHSGPNGPFIE